MPVVQSTIVRPDGTGQANINITVSLVGTGGGAVKGYVTANDREIAGTQTLTTDDSGFWSVTLTANSLITPSGTVYRLHRENLPSDPDPDEFILVPNTAGPFNVADILTSAPGSIAPTELAAHIADSGAHGGVGGTTNHGSLTNVTADQHHAQAHSISGADHTGTLTHAALSSVTADQHHAQAHSISGADHTGTLAHSALSGVTADVHHTESHATRHQLAGADRLPELIPLVFHRSGSLTVGSGTSRYYTPWAVTIVKVTAAVATPSAGASLIFDVNISTTPEGTAATAYSTQANRPTITAGNHYVSASLPDITAVPADGYVTVDQDQVGSSTAGSTADVTVWVTRN